MFHWHRDRTRSANAPTSADAPTEPRTNPSGKAFLRKRPERHGAESYGFTGLEGDFEAERRRAAAAAHEPAEPYEGEGPSPSVPGSSGGLTHP